MKNFNHQHKSLQLVNLVPGTSIRGGKGGTSQNVDIDIQFGGCLKPVLFSPVPNDFLCGFDLTDVTPTFESTVFECYTNNDLVSCETISVLLIKMHETIISQDGDCQFMFP